jgi:hypothetical protein
MKNAYVTLGSFMPGDGLLLCQVGKRGPGSRGALGTPQLELALRSLTVNGHVVSDISQQEASDRGLRANRRTGETVGGGALIGAMASVGTGAAIGVAADARCQGPYKRRSRQGPRGNASHFSARAADPAGGQLALVSHLTRVRSSGLWRFSLSAIQRSASSRFDYGRYRIFALVKGRQKTAMPCSISNFPP